MMMKGFFTAALAALAVSAAVLALAGCSDGGGNKASPVSGTVDMTRMTADEVKTAIGAALFPAPLRSATLSTTPAWKRST